MNRLAWLLPHPVLSLSLALIWMALQARLDPPQALLGAVLGLGLPVVLRAYWPERPPFHRLPLLWRLFFRVNWDILVACVAVSWLTLTRRSSTLQPRFATVRMECRDQYAQTLLVTIVSITPGTMVADLDAENGLMLVHWLHQPDVDQAIENLKARYDDPLKEILG